MVTLVTLVKPWCAAGPCLPLIMNIVAEHFWEFLQKNPNMTKPVNPILPHSDQCIMLNTMAELCIGGELLCESMEPDMSICDNESAGGSGTQGGRARNGKGRNKRSGKGKGGRGGMMRSGMMRANMMKHGMMGGGIGPGRGGKKGGLSKIKEEGGDSDHHQAPRNMPAEKKPSTIECFAEIVSIPILLRFSIICSFSEISL